MIPFYPSRSDNQVVTPSAVSGSVLVNADVSSIRLVNSGTKICYVKLGHGPQVATTADIPVMAGESIVLGKGYTEDTCAFISPSGTTLNIQTGTGGVFNFITPLNDVGTIDLVNLTALMNAAPTTIVEPSYFLGLLNGVLKRVSSAFYNIAQSIGAANIVSGDLLVGSGVSTFKRLGLGSANKLLGVNAGGNDLEYKTVAGAAVASAATIVIGTNATDPIVAANLKAATALADFWLTKRTKMPDGATAIYSEDVWAELTNIETIGAGTKSVAVTSGACRFTRTNTTANQGFRKFGIAPPGVCGKVIVVRYRTSPGSTGNFGLCCYSSSSLYATLPLSVNWTVGIAVIPIYTSTYTGSIEAYVGAISTVGAIDDWFEVDWWWVGDYSYLSGSLSEEAARIADQLGDTPGVGAAATATITSNGMNVNTPAFGTLTTTTSLPAADSMFKVGTKTYTWKSALTPTEGEVLLEATVAACLTNARDAVNGTAGTLGTKHQCTANALFTATASATILTVTAILRGTVGNGATYEIVAGVGSELTASGALATGGVDDTVTVGGLQYKFVGQTAAVPYEITTGGDYQTTIVRLGLTINGGYGATPAGSAHPLVSYVSNSPATTINLAARTPGILGNSITITKSAATLTLANPAGGTTTLAGGVDDAGAKAKAQIGPAIGAGAGVGAMATRTSTSIIGYRGVADCASGAQVTLPAGGTWLFRVATYGATYNSVMAGTAAGGLMSGTASANLRMFYERIA